MTTTIPSISDNQPALDALRQMRGQLYDISAAAKSAMSLADQLRYGDNLVNIGTAILRLEAAQMQAVNDQFEAKSAKLNAAAKKLANDAAQLADGVKVIRAISDGLGVVMKIVALLG